MTRKASARACRIRHRDTLPARGCLWPKRCLCELQVKARAPHVIGPTSAGAGTRVLLPSHQQILSVEVLSDLKCKGRDKKGKG